MPRIFDVFGQLTAVFFYILALYISLWCLQVYSRMSSVLKKSKAWIERESKEADNRLGLAASRLWLKVHTVSIGGVCFPTRPLKYRGASRKALKTPNQHSIDL